MHRLAIIADPHFHALFPGYRFPGVPFRGRAGAAIRTGADSAASTRIFNESWFAFPAALDACVTEGLRTVLIAGDLTDDGQVASMDAALELLAHYERQHGLRFFLTPGNHDVYGMSGRHHAKAFLDGQGGETRVTSDPSATGPHGVHEPAMFCRSYVQTAPLWAPYGVRRRPGDLHWECPFGSDDSFEARFFEMESPDGSVVHRQLDLSYLVEPEPGLWIVSVDANVFEPRDGHPDNSHPDAFADSTDAGWNALVRLKPFILDWLADVARRAGAQGKTIVCFSHYPVLDTHKDTAQLELGLFGLTPALKRVPSLDTSMAFARTGIGTHFSGHLHISGVNTLSHDAHTLTNVAMPSPVAFPPAFTVVSACGHVIEIEHRPIEMADFDAFFPFYRSERPGSDWTDARSYGGFLYRHVRELVMGRYLPREWPADLAQAMQTLSVLDLFAMADMPEGAEPGRSPPQPPDDGPSGIDLVTDWYAMRKAGALALHFVPADRLVLYRRLIAAYTTRVWSDPASLQSRLTLFLGIMARYLDAACARPAAA